VDILIWCFTALLLFIGLVGCVVPVLPGTTLILAGMILHKLLLPEQISWFALGGITLFWLLSVVADFAGILIGARLFGGSKWGMTGASGGALVGMFFSLPALILGTFLGAVAGEKIIAKKSDGASLRSGVGATIGFLLSTVVRVACAIAMIALFLFAAFGYYTVA
jgi:uncharacterized protein YqgC (DUF456 family)